MIDPVAGPVRARETPTVVLHLCGVPAALHRRLHEQAAREGMSLSRLVIGLLEENLDRTAAVDGWLTERRRLTGGPMRR